MKKLTLYAALAVFLNGACNDKSDIIPTIEYLRVYPNPAVDNVSVGVQNQSSNESCSIKILDPNAAIIFEVEGDLNNQEFNIDLTTKPSGSYNVILQKGSSTYIHKLVKQ